MAVIINIAAKLFFIVYLIYFSWIGDRLNYCSNKSKTSARTVALRRGSSFGMA
jgi:uncharacterized membrane protein